MPFRPTLGIQIEDKSILRFPVYASLKLDGFRALKLNGLVVSRNLKPIPNIALQRMFDSVPDGYDGELIWGEPNAKDVFRRTSSCVTSYHESAAGVRWFVFDNFLAFGGFEARNATLTEITNNLGMKTVCILPQKLLQTINEVENFSINALHQGYEGVILRTPHGMYKEGRSTLREQIMLKMKPFSDAEATILGVEEQMHNGNEATTDERGYTKRSHHQANMIPTGKLGALRVTWMNHEFNIGTGFTDDDRRRFWEQRDTLLGKVVKFKYLPIGVKDAPRHPVWLGFRDPIDS